MTQTTTSTNVCSAERTKFLADIITTAVEGGINYWANVRNYRWSDQAPETTYVEIEEDEKPSFWTPVTVDLIDTTLGKIQRGEGKVPRNGSAIFGVHPSYRKTIVAADALNDACDIDVEHADVIVQIAMFGEVVYG